MLRSKYDVPEGRVVYLYPHTKTAGQWCWRRKTAVVIDTDHWPRVHVSLTDGDKDIESYVHKDDVRLKPAAPAKRVDREGGDTVTHGGSSGTSVRVIRRKVIPIDLPDGVEQGELF